MIRQEVEPVARFPDGEYLTDSDLREWIVNNSENFRGAVNGTSAILSEDRFGLTIERKGDTERSAKRLSFYFYNDQSLGHEVNGGRWDLSTEKDRFFTEMARGVFLGIEILPEGMGVKLRSGYNGVYIEETHISSDFGANTSVVPLS